jgi:anti-anti-sigma factor
MDIVVDQLNPQTRCIRLSGRLDMKGAGLIEQRFTTLTATHDNKVIVDMGGVDFLASIGMRLLLTCAKANALRGGQMVLANPQPLVKQALETAGIDDLIPIFADEAIALMAFSD